MASDPIGGVVNDLLGTFSFGGIQSTINIVIWVVIVGLIVAAAVWFGWKATKYKIHVIVKTQRADSYVTGYDRMGLFKKNGVTTARLWKRKLDINIPKYDSIVREKGFGDIVFLIIGGAGTAYQLSFPSYPDPKSLKVIDYNVTRLASQQLREAQSIYTAEQTFLQQYGVHIAWLVLVVVIAIAMWLVLRKAEAIISIAQQQMDINREALNAIIQAAG